MASPEETSASPSIENNPNGHDANLSIIKHAFRELFDVSDGPDGEVIVAPRTPQDKSEETMQP
jgi:hypothetical protein